MSVADLIDALETDKKADAADIFRAEINSRISDALDAKRVEIGRSVYAQPPKTKPEEE
jgi:hypothetical protein